VEALGDTPDALRAMGSCASTLRIWVFLAHP